MNYDVSEWLNLIVRWFHVFAGILWIGQTFLFTWMDRALDREDSLWLVHSGGFYIVNRQRIPQNLPQTLHWFRWEAAMTWLSGFTLLVIVYYFGGLMDTQVLGGVVISIAVCLILLELAWVAYDALWRSPLARNEPLCAAVSFALLVGVIFLLTHIMTGRAAYIHVGALLATFMTA